MVRISATSRHIRPAAEHERVVAVVLGAAAHHHQEGRFEAAARARRDRPRRRRRARSSMSWNQTSGSPSALAVDLVGALVDDLEAHVLQHRHALGERDRPVVAPDLQADGAALVAGAAVEVDAERPRRRQALDDADVGDRGGRRIGLAIAVRRMRRDSARTARAPWPARRPARARRRARRSRCARSRRPPAPGSRGRDSARRPSGAADDEMDAHQRSFRKERIEGADAAVVGLGEIVADRLAHVAVVAVARHVDEDRDEAVEAVAARQHAHARPLVELQDRQREVIQRVLVDLEQLVARIGLQHVDQRLAGMAVRIEAGARQHGVDLAAQIRDRAGRARIGGRGEQADDAELADRACRRRRSA